MDKTHEKTRTDRMDDPVKTDPKTADDKATKTTPDIFAQAVGFVLKDRIEGGHVNDPRDPGGETKFGISRRSYPKLDIRALTRDQAIDLYRRDYWDQAGCATLPPKLAVAVFDCAVNQGVGVALRLLQKAAGVGVDGVIGPQSRKAIEAACEADLLVQFLGWRLRRYAFTANASTHMRGWANRVLYLQQFLATEIKVA